MYYFIVPYTDYTDDDKIKNMNCEPLLTDVHPARSYQNARDPRNRTLIMNVDVNKQRTLKQVNKERCLAQGFLTASWLKLILKQHFVSWNRVKIHCIIDYKINTDSILFLPWCHTALGRIPAVSHCLNTHTGKNHSQTALLCCWLTGHWDRNTGE